MFFVFLLVGASLLGLAAILIAAKMPRDEELYTAWSWTTYVTLATTAFFVVVTFLDSPLWLIPALLFAIATWNLGGVLSEVEGKRRRKMYAELSALGNHE